MKKRISKKHRRLLLSLICIFSVLFCAYAFFQNNLLVVSHYEIEDVKIPTEFDGFTIAQISDFHNTHSRLLQEDIIEGLLEIKPDIIVLTGDFIDTRRTDTALALSYAARLLEIAPVYMSAGNHEAATVEEYPPFEKELISLGVRVLRNECEKIELGGSAINITGIDDPVFFPGEDKYEKIAEAIDTVTYDESIFTVTLSHRPEVFSVYVEKQQDLVLSGHAHGGQFRIPGIGGLYIPTEGLFPTYTEGVHTLDSTKMVVSRGIGSSVFPIRINNRPELVIISLRAE